MKYLTLIISFLLLAVGVNADDNKKDIVTETYLVSGNCGECKERIEKAAYVKGVKLAEWDKEEKKLTVTYKKSKTSGEEILKSIADAGYDSEKITASEEAYAKLPACCNYRTGSCGD